MPEIDFKALATAASFDNFRQAPILDTLANDALLAPNSKLEQALANTEAKGLPPISVTPMSGQHLSTLTQLMGAKTVLEIGTLEGYPAICFAQ
ncbi:O-methyltransferase, partial [Fusarium globosum]